MSVVQAYGVVRSDISGDATDRDAELIGELCARFGFELRAVRVQHGDGEFGLLLATLAPSGITALVVPTVAHLAGWLDVTRQDSTVWTLRPAGCWPRLPASNDAAAEFVPGESA